MVAETATMMIRSRSLPVRPLMAIAMASLSLGVISCAALVANDAKTTRLPSNLAVPDGLQSKQDWQKSSMIPLDLSLGTVTKQDELSASSMIEQHTKNRGAVMFAVRRPGCILCREEGQMLSQLAAENPDVFQDFGLFGIVKEVAVDDEGLLEFHEKFFPHPLYLDESQQVYEALGKRKITSLKTWNPFRLYRGFKEMKARLEKKSDLSGNMKGEGIVQGGIIILDKEGEARAVYLEETGSEPPVDDILEALKSLQIENQNAEKPQAVEL